MGLENSSSPTVLGSSEYGNNPSGSTELFQGGRRRRRKSGRKTGRRVGKSLMRMGGKKKSGKRRRTKRRMSLKMF